MRRRTIESVLPTSILSVVYTAAAIDPFTEWNHNHRAIFIHVPKAAGRSLATALGMGGTSHIPIKRYWAADRSATQSSLTFAVLRDPVDRFSSAFHSLRGSSPENPDTPHERRYSEWVRRNIDVHTDVESFIESMRSNRAHRRRVMGWYHFVPQSTWITRGGSVGVDLLGDYDRLDEFWGEIQARLDIEAELPAIGRRSTRPTMSDDSANFVRSLYAQDLDTLDGLRRRR